MHSSNPVAILTGGTGGIGLATAALLADEGMDLILTYRSNRKRAEEARDALLKDRKIHIELVEGDLASSDMTANIMDRFLHHFSGQELRAVLHLAGIYVDGMEQHKLATGSAKWLEIYDYYQNLYPKCLVRLIEASLPYMKDDYGRILTLSTPGCNQTQCPRPFYAIPGQAKATLEQLVRYYALALAPRRITVNTVLPGITLTEGWRLPAAEIVAMAERRCPMKSVLQPNDVAQTLAFLCSEKASFITGTSFPVDGGLHLV